MCGILGIASRHVLGDNTFRRALALLDHRGPDDQDHTHQDLPNNSHLYLGHTRLAILDLSQQGHQPMISPRTGASIVYNGEVYNFKEIRQELKGEGYNFHSNCDTEVILAAYDQWGKDCLERFNGMFALCIFDKQKNHLFLARDRVGIKPLYYSKDNSAFAFSSELYALLAIQKDKPGIDHRAVVEYFQYGYFSRESTPLLNYSKLLPGHWLEYDIETNKANIHKYWDPIAIYSKPKFTETEDDLSDRLEELLLDSVKKCMLSDVPLGAFLSSGVDSSLIVALMCKAQLGEVKTYSIGVDNFAMDEAPMAKKIAHHLGTDHHVEYIHPDSIKDTIQWANAHYDEPFADYSSIPTSIMSQIIRKNVTVALSGDGGDELHVGYSGYPRWVLFQKYSKFPKILKRSVTTALKFSPIPLHRQWANTLVKCENVGDFYSHCCSSKGAKSIMAELPHSICDPTALDALVRLPGADWREIALATDLAVKLPGDYLMKVDRASMGSSLEVRVPFLDYRFIEFSARLPIEMKCKGGVGKYLLKKVLHRHVPKEFYTGPKRGFTIPLGEWFRRDLKGWIEGLLLEGNEWMLDLIDPDAVRKLLRMHQQREIDATYTIWALISWRLWLERVNLL